MATKKTTKKSTKKVTKKVARKDVVGMEAKVYKSDGKESGRVVLPESIFGVKWNSDLVHQVVLGMQANARQPWAHTKDRSEVRGGGRKPWRQKGTGRARHGSRRSPIWVGGGVTFGPRKERDFSKKINKKMRMKALFSTLSRKHEEGEVLFVEDLMLKTPKTTDAKKMLSNLASVKGFEGLATKKKNAVLVVTIENDLNAKRSFKNFGNVEVEEVRNLNPVDLLTYKYLMIAKPKDSIKILEEKLK